MLLALPARLATNWVNTRFPVDYVCVLDLNETSLHFCLHAR